MRKMSQANEKEFNELASYICFFSSHVRKIAPDDPVHPAHFLTSGKFTKSQLLTGLRQAANDTIEVFSGATQRQIAALDNACRASAVLTLSEVRRRFSRQYKAIIKRQKITRETDYYLVVAILNDLESEASEDERRLLETLVQAYEEKSVTASRDMG